MNVFVTGGAGYIGSICTEQLLNAGHQVTVYDNLTEGHRSAVDARARFIQGRPEQEGDLLQAVQSAKPEADRKSTRLNSSHVSISYAVFCSKKKLQLVLHPPPRRRVRPPY